MIHKTEAQEGFVKSSRQASSPSPQVPQFRHGGAGSGAVSGQGVPARFGYAGAGSVPPAMSSCTRSLVCRNTIFPPRLDCNV